MEIPGGVSEETTPIPKEVFMRLEPINLMDYEARAKQVLPYNVWEEIESGAMDEVTTRRNRTALGSVVLRPRFLQDVQERDLTTTVLGTPISFPGVLSARRVGIRSPTPRGSWPQPGARESPAQ